MPLYILHYILYIPISNNEWLNYDHLDRQIYI